MKQFSRFLSILLSLVLLSSLVLNTTATDLNTSYRINTPYEYPITPDSPEWLAMSTHSERIRSCQIPEDILINMSTSSLVETIATYPLLIDLMLFNTADDAYSSLLNNFNAVRELESRADALPVLTSFIKTNTDIQSDYIRKTALEIIALSGRFPSLQLSTYTSLQLDFSEAYKFYPDLTSSSTSSAAQLRVAAPTTPSGNAITERWEYNKTPEHTLEKIGLLEEEILAVYGLYPARDATVKYNCHSYAFHDQSANNLYWIDFPDDYLEDPLVTSIPLSQVRVNDRICYRVSTSGRFMHSGIITIANNATTMVTSKWGAAGLYNHTIGNCPSSYGNYVSFYRVDN